MAQLASLIRRMPVGWIGRFILLRLLARWQATAAWIMGVGLVAVIGATIPLYTVSIAQIGMVQRLEHAPAQNAQVSARTSLRAAQFAPLDAAWARMDSHIRQHVATAFSGVLDGWVLKIVSAGETTPMQVVVQDTDLPARLSVAHFESWQQAAYLVEGEWPAEPSDPAIDLEAALGRDMATQLGLQAGSDIVLEQRGWESSIPVRVRITAIVEAIDALQTGTPPMLRISSAPNGGLESNILTTRASFLRVAEAHVPDTGTTFGWWVLFDHSALEYAHRADAIAGVEAFKRRIVEQDVAGAEGSTFIFATQLPAILDEYETEVDTLRAPFGILLLEIGVLALFYLMVTAALLRRSDRREIAILKSRGIASGRLLTLHAAEALVICTLAAAIAPFVSQWFLEWIVPLLTRIEHLDLTLDRTVFAAATIAAGVAGIVQVATLLPVLRLPLTSGGGAQARDVKSPWWQRYYVDLVLLLIGAAAFWRLITNRSPLNTTQTGSVQADPLLLLAPVLLFVAVGSVLLRVFPAVSGALARLVARRRQLTAPLAAWHVSREPAHYGQITFLLALAIGIGWLATSFQVTLARSQHDRAAYAVGSDIRIEERDTTIKTRRIRPLAFYTALPSVEAISPAARYFVPNIGSEGRQSVAGEVLAVDPATFGAVSYWRDDLGELMLPDSAAALPTPGRVLPVRPARISLWARLDQPVLDAMARPVLSESGAVLYEPNTDQLRAMVGIGARLRDANGMPVHVALSIVDLLPDSGWAYLEGSVPETVPGDLRLESIYWHNGWQWHWTRSRSYRLYLAALALTAPDGTHVALDWLANDARWDVLHDSGGAIDATADIVPSPDAPGDLRNSESFRVTWDQDGNRSVLGMVLNYPEPGPIPAIVSEELVALNGLLPGTRFQVGAIEYARPWFEMAATTAYFPSLYADRPFIVIDQQALLYTLNRRPSADLFPSEVWLRLEDGASSNAAIDALHAQTDQSIQLSIRTYDDALNSLDENMLLAGLIGLLYLAFGVALALAIISHLTYSALTTFQRRAQYGVLRALGLSANLLVATIALEHLIVLVTGTLLGALLGAGISAQMIPTLALGATGESITPPFMIRFEQAALAQYAVLVLLLMVVTSSASVVLVRRLTLGDLLRFGEE